MQDRIEELVEEIDRVQARVVEHRRQELVVQRRTWAEWARESEVYRERLREIRLQHIVVFSRQCQATSRGVVSKTTAASGPTRHSSSCKYCTRPRSVW
jgi:hypothetical protein